MKAIPEILHFLTSFIAIGLFEFVIRCTASRTAARIGRIHTARSSIGNASGARRSGLQSLLAIDPNIGSARRLRLAEVCDQLPGIDRRSGRGFEHRFLHRPLQQNRRCARSIRFQRSASICARLSAARSSISHVSTCASTRILLRSTLDLQHSAGKECLGHDLRSGGSLQFADISVVRYAHQDLLRRHCMNARSDRNLQLATIDPDPHRTRSGYHPHRFRYRRARR